MDSNYNELSFAYDLTKLEREQQKKLLTEAKKRDQEEGGKWKHRVRGPPWDLKIVRKEVAKAQTQQQNPIDGIEEGKEAKENKD